jgi:hypothetical protein
MLTRVALVLLGACAALAVTGHAQGAARDCMPISVAGTFTYAVHIESGSVGCGSARTVLRDAADWPPGERRATAGWICKAGQDPGSWAISCARGAATVRAYGPVRERDAWVIADVRLRIGLLAPTSTAALVVAHVGVRSCGGREKWVVADYTRPDGATLTIGEGRPYPCGNIGVEPLLALWRIHGQPARLSEFCAPTGCARLQGDYALEWRERGVGITLLTHGLTQRELLTIARSMTAVPA